MNKKRKISFVMTGAFWGLLFIFVTATNSFAQTCGNGQIEPGEQCDGANTSGGCCTAQCTFAAADSVCTDGNPNTIDSCNAAGVCVGRAQTTTCGACRNPNDAQDRSYCDPATNQCVRQIEDCAPFFIEADGSENKCQSNYGRDPNTGQCFYRKKQCIPGGCFKSECDPTDGVCKTTDADDPRNAECEGSDTFCQPDGTCEMTACAYESCDPQGDFRNCDNIINTNCADENVGSCQTPRPTDPAEGIIFGCQANQGCVYQAVVCEQSANPCEELVRDQEAQGCCTYQPRNCAAEFGNNPNFTYTCDPTATNGVCQAVIKPEQCNGADDNGNGTIDEGFPNTDGDGQANCVDADDDNDGQTDADEIACGSNPLLASSKSLDTDSDNRPNCVDTDDDNDGVLDAADNCPLTPNANQSDMDGDGIGDVCDSQTVLLCFGRTATITDNSSGDQDRRIGFIRGGNGADVIIGTNNAETIDGGNSDDRICSFGGADQIEGGNGNDLIDAGAGDDLVNDDNGNDTILGGDGNDRVDDGNGNDRIEGGAGEDTLNGGNGNDVVLGGNGNDTLIGGDGDDFLSGGSGNDTLTGSAGADCFIGGLGNDTATDCNAAQGDRRDNTVESGACPTGGACSS